MPEVAAEVHVERDPRMQLLALYDRAVPQVFHYVRHRCRTDTEAEEITADTFLAAVVAVKHNTVPELTVAWLIGVARHKLVDHWRRQSRDERKLHAVEREVEPVSDPWQRTIDSARAHEVLARLGAHHRSALTLRYLDDLPVPKVAELLDRTVHATEALLTRSRLAFRRAYEANEGSGDV